MVYLLWISTTGTYIVDKVPEGCMCVGVGWQSLKGKQGGMGKGRSAKEDAIEIT